MLWEPKRHRSWLLCCALLGAALTPLEAHATLGVSKTRAPGYADPVYIGDTDGFLIQLTNNFTDGDITNVAFIDNMPAGFRVDGSGVVSTTCADGNGNPVPFSGTVTAALGSSSIALSGGTIPSRGTGTQAGRCEIVVQVTSTVAGSGNNVLPAGSVTGTHQGTTVSNADPAQQSLNFLALPAPSISKSFAAGTIVKADQATRLTITIRNNAAQPLPLNDVGDNPPFAIRDRLGDYGLKVAPAPAMQISCGATPPTFNPTAGDTQVTALGGVVPASGTCSLSVMVVADGSDSAYSEGLTNVIDRVSDFGNKRGLVPAQNATANLTVTAPLRVAKTFDPQTVAKGQEALLRITLSNASPLSTLTLSGLTDPIDGGVGGLTITSPPTATCSSGSSATVSGAGTSTLSLTAGTLAPNGNCVIHVPYTATLTTAGQPQTYTNTIEQGAVSVSSPANVVSQRAVASVNVVDQFLIEKTSSPSTVAPGNPVSFSVAVRNYSATAQSGVTVTDHLPGGMVLLRSPDRPEPSVSGDGCASAVAVAGSATSPTFTFDMAGGTAGNPAECNLSFWGMVPANAASGAVINQIPAGGVCANGICNHSSTSAQYSVSSATLTLEKGFDASSKPEGSAATMTIDLVNLSAQPLSDVSLLDSLPLGSNGTPMQVASPSNASSTCGGVLVAVPGSNEVRLSGAGVPARAGNGLDAQGRCRVTVNVVGAAGHYVNSLPAGAASAVERYADGSPNPNRLQSPGPVNASVDFLSALSGTKSFVPNRIQPDGRSTVTINLSNSQAGVLTNVSVTDNLPAGMTVANPSNAYSTCDGAPVVQAAPGSSQVTLTGARIPTGSCDLLFDVTATGSGDWVNTIGVGQLSADGGVQNVTPFGATLQNASGGGVTVSLNHATASVAAPGAVTQLTYTLFNSGSLDLTSLALASYFTDTGLAGGSPTGERTAAVPNARTTCPGGVVNAPANGTRVSLDGATLAAGQSCTVTVDVTMVNTGTVTATVPASAISTAQGVSNTDSASSSLQTSSGLGVTKQFTPKVVAAGERSRLRITFYNPTTQPITELTATDTYPVGLVTASPANVVSTCQGSVTSSSAQVALGGGRLAAGSGSAPASCYVEIDVVASSQGDYVNTIPSATVTGDAGGSPVTNDEPTTDTLLVKSPLIVHKAIAARTLDAGNPAGFTTGTAAGSAGIPLTLAIRLQNPNAGALSGLGYTDSLPDGMVLAQVPNPRNTCGGTLTAAPSGKTVRLAGGDLAGNATCLVEVEVLSNVAGTYTNTIAAGGVTSFEGVSNAEPTRARLVISSPPTLGKQFAPAVIPAGGTSRLTIFVNNPNAAAMSLTAALTDDLPTAPGPVRVAATPNIGGSCPGGAITATPNASFVRLASGTQVAAGGCTIEVDVTATTAGEHTNIIPARALQTDMGENPEPVYASLSVSTLGFISGRVYLDNDLSGSYSAGIDRPLAGIAIELRSGTSCASGALVGGINGLLNPATTDAAGNYLFSGLPAGTYSVCQSSQPAGSLNGLPVAGSIVAVNGSSGTAGTPSNPSETSSQIAAIVLDGSGAAGEVSGSGGNDFPEMRPATLSGSVFVDLNNDGTRQSGESGLPGVLIELVGTDASGSPVSRSTTTDGNGDYRFTDLPPGTYRITEPNQPDGTTNGISRAGNSDGGAPTATPVSSTPSVIDGVRLSPGYASEGNNFAELLNGRSIYGKVFHDRDVNGAPTAGDSGLAGQAITLIGSDLNGNNVSRSTVTDANGDFNFIGLPPGTYTLVQPNQPNGLMNGSTTAGSAGGTVSEGPSTIATIDLTGTALSVDNWFAEISIPSLSGTVWIDSNHDRIRDPGETVLPGWTVELLQQGTVIATTVSDANGGYAFNDLQPGGGYEVRFRHPDSGTLFGRPVPNEQGLAYTPGSAGPGNPAGADNGSGTLTNIVIGPGRNLVEQSLPLDPAGVVYDAISRQPVRGAVVSISGPAGFTEAHVLGGSLSQTTGADGLYQFLLLTGAPTGTYNLSITSPAGYLPGPSSLIPVCNTVLSVNAVPDPALVQSSNQAPAEAVTPHDAAACPTTSAGLVGTANTTQYFLSFVLNSSSADLVNNHIPLDPVMGGAIVMTKVTPKVNVSRGELVPYTLTARNALGVSLADIAIEDQIPPGFKYVKNSAQLDGVPIEPDVEGRRLRWPGRTLGGGQVMTVKLLLVVGSGVGFNEYVNQTWALNLAAGLRVSNVATASVRVVADPTFDCSDLIGKVFDDKNRNGYQDEGEPGLPGVRLATPKGWLITTDAHGRYHIACADVPSEMRGSNFILKVDERTLPSGYRIITENPRVVRMTQGRLVKANFGASIHRVVRLDLTGEAFEGQRLTAVFQARMDEVLAALYAEPSILRIAYHLPVGGDIDTARSRVGYVKDWIQAHWEPHECCYDLQLEEEIVAATESVEVIR
ncbi:DUF7933 domain-containing protein [Stutzerimonas azotifigens]|uniref:DUF11 domain-containing protein n=1 Tax=Stutzerimonas azotifigens TaxID=291995 RepID=A0ABR5Z1S9_9GAMM|nr:SdrD B-like domain-containing protein [Stutzerimonas azotifigens]MBA1274137.1 DUF11 domain-containing protein [Stutzerimonas azotifigens]